MLIRYELNTIISKHHTKLSSSFGGCTLEDAHTTIVQIYTLQSEEQLAFFVVVALLRQAVIQEVRVAIDLPLQVDGRYYQ